MQRNEIDKKYLWNTADIFESEEAWEKLFLHLKIRSLQKI